MDCVGGFLDIGWFQFVLKECVPVPGRHLQLSIPFYCIHPLLPVKCIQLPYRGCFPLFYGFLVLCPPTWRINTYTKAICSYALGWSVNTCVYACPPHFLSNCHAVGVVLVGDPVLYVIFCTKYELICSFNTFCTCIHLYYVQKTYKTTYEFHFQLVFSRRVRSVTSLRSSLAARRTGEHSLYVLGVLRVGDPVLYVKYCHFCTKYELICSFNTFCTCICPIYVQKTYKTTYEFHFQLAFSRRVRSG